MNYYEILQISSNATKEEIRKAYRRLSLKYHPDKSFIASENNNKFNEISIAYQTLSDELQRKIYDSSIINESFNDKEIIDEQSSKCKIINTISIPDISVVLGVTIQQSYIGYSAPIEIKRFFFENFIQKEEIENIYINIPRGIDNNEIIIIKEKGNISETGNRGDIKVKINFINDTRFTRCGLDLIYNKNISLREALCGFSFSIKYLNNDMLTINNTEGNVIENNYKKTIENYGMIRENMSGNLIINFNIIFPTNISLENIKKLKDIL